MIVNGYCIAQPSVDAKRDYIWQMGYSNGTNTGGINYGITKLDFNIQSFTQTRLVFDAEYNMTSAMICDSSGQLLLSTNGKYLYNSNNQKITAANLSCTTQILNDQPGYNTPQGALILPQPEHPNTYYIFHNCLAEPYAHNNTTVWYNNELVYHTVEIGSANPQGAVTSFRQPLIPNDSLDLGKITACRHANGRDWWIIIWRGHGTQVSYGRILLDQQGVHFLGWEPFESFIDGRGGWQCVFSPDGSKYVRQSVINFSSAYLYNSVSIYDFDRCSGYLNNQIRQTAQVTSSGGGVSISPNSRYLYANEGKYIYQYDLHAPNIFASKDTVAVYDNFRDTITTLGYPTRFNLAQLAPDGKIYLSSTNAVRYLHVIENPDIGGAGCNVRQHGIRLLTINAFSIPNYPNFRLGRLVGSTCDTLYNSISTQEKERHIRVFPNPTNGILNIEIPPNIKGISYLYNALGQIIKQITISNQITQINTYDIPNGIYFISIVDASGRIIGRQRVIVQHGGI
jgi:hypothetical protein